MKASLLVWDRVYRIVPESYTPRDDDEVALAVDDGLIRSVRLEKTDVGEAATAFQALLDDFATLPSGFDPGGGVTNIHLDKIDARLYPVLEGLAEQISDQWIGLPSEVARGYMLTLATEVAKRRQLTLTTDDPDAWVASSFINERGAFSEFVYDNDAAEQYCQLGFADVLPLDVRTLDMKKLIALSRESTDDRAAFRANVAELAERVRLCESPSHAQDILSDYRDTLRSSTDALRNRFGFFRKTEGYSLLSVGIPIATSILASLLPLH